ncbi:hypothetical protein HPB51_016317 [Rhipicephalus microplus]|uniref:Uncharacterized protein n=1 Tax=Rhipicephalus microplus TaxID=6941 RepID=A0A9J6EPB8_RHIMP|nr:hypothetical protein HPB51_016317 [Rhipicephalus microplus]
MAEKGHVAGPEEAEDVLRNVDSCAACKGALSTKSMQKCDLTRGLQEQVTTHEGTYFSKRCVGKGPSEVMALAFSSSDQAAIDRTVVLSADDVKPAADDRQIECQYEVKRTVAWICENGFKKASATFPSVNPRDKAPKEYIWSGQLQSYEMEDCI